MEESEGNRGEGCLIISPRIKKGGKRDGWRRRSEGEREGGEKERGRSIEWKGGVREGEGKSRMHI